MSDHEDSGVLEGAGSGTVGGAGVRTDRAPLPTLLAELLWVQMWELGPLAQFSMLRASLPEMSNGLQAVGASSVIAAVRLGRPKTVAIAKITAIMVKAEYVDLIAGITSKVAQECPECVAKVSVELTLMKEMQVLSLITKRMVDRGELKESTIVAKAVAEHGHSEFLKMVAPDGATKPLDKAKEGLHKAGEFLKGKGGGNGKHAAKCVCTKELIEELLTQGEDE